MKESELKQPVFLFSFEKSYWSEDKKMSSKRTDILRSENIKKKTVGGHPTVFLQANIDYCSILAISATGKVLAILITSSLENPGAFKVIKVLFNGSCTS